MGIVRLNTKALGVLAALSLAGATGAYSTVSQSDHDASLADLRAELLAAIDAGDERVAGELGARLEDIERRMAAMEADLQQMEQDFEVSIQRLEEELRFNVPVYFGFDDATVEEEDQAVLDRFSAVALKYYPTARITVEGFTDPSGPEAYNIWLGQRRADAVMEYLVTESVMSAEQLRAVSYGEDTHRLVMPEEWGPGVPGWQNRRVVLVIDHDGMPPAAVADAEEVQG